MQVFLAVMDAGSLSAAGRQLNAPLATVSRKVSELERHLGTRLLIRTSRTIQLTDAGRDYLEAARQIVAQIRDAELRASGEYEVPRGELTVTVPIDFGRHVALSFICDFLAQFPSITLNVLSVDRAVHLVEERVDVGIRIGQLADSSLYAVNVGDLYVLNCASPAYLQLKGRPACPEDLNRHDAVLFDRIPNPWTFSRDGSRHRGQPNIRVHTNTMHGAVAAAVGGLGITRVFNYLVADQLRSGALIPILTEYDTERLPVHLVYIRQGLLPLKVRAFLDWMAPRLRQKLQELPSGR
ncbi:LysR family transcriptional regulator [Rhizobium mongolense]|uniref:LysR family transcriptional regulator n=1 Tax=Rhizobium mongolense TaxID=57676 RepID=UPI0034A4DB42